MDWREKLKAIEHVPVTRELLDALQVILKPAWGYQFPLWLTELSVIERWDNLVEEITEIRNGYQFPANLNHRDEITHFLLHGTDFSGLYEMADLKFAAAVEICREAFGW